MHDQIAQAGELGLTKNPSADGGFAAHVRAVILKMTSTAELGVASRVADHAFEAGALDSAERGELHQLITARRETVSEIDTVAHRASVEVRSLRFQQLAANIRVTRAHARLDRLSRTASEERAKAAEGGEGLSEDEYGELCDLIETRRRSPQDIAPRRVSIVVQPTVSFFPRRKPATSVLPATYEERQARLQQRRDLAASYHLPAEVRRPFGSSAAGQAVLKIIADEVQAEGICHVKLGAIAARARCHIDTARVTIHKAAHLGFLSIQEQRQQGAKNRAHLIRVVSKAWAEWIRSNAKWLEQNRSAAPRKALDPNRSFCR